MGNTGRPRLKGIVGPKGSAGPPGRDVSTISCRHFRVSNTQTFVQGPFGPPGLPGLKGNQGHKVCIHYYLLS